MGVIGQRWRERGREGVGMSLTRDRRIVFGWECPVAEI